MTCGIDWRRFAVLSVVCIMFAVAGCGRADSGNQEQKAQTAPDKKVADAARVDRVVVYYFHNTRRCATCLGIQKAIEETIDSKFQKDIDADMLVFKELNMEEAANKKYVAQFQLTFGTMIVAAEAKGETRKWENAGKVWEFAQSPGDLKAYVEKMIRQQLDLIGREV